MNKLTLAAICALLPSPARAMEDSRSARSVLQLRPSSPARAMEEPGAKSCEFKPKNEAGLAITVETVGMRLGDENMGAAILRTGVAISYPLFSHHLDFPIFNRLDGRTAASGQIFEFTYTKGLDDGSSLRLILNGVGGLVFTQGVSLRAFEWSWFSLMLFGDLEYTPVSPAVGVKKAEIIFGENIVPITTVVADHVKFLYRHERYDVGALISGRFGQFQAFILAGAMSVNLTLEVAADDELSSQLKSRSIELAASYKIQTVKPFWAAGVSYTFGDHWTVGGAGTFLGLSPLANFGLQTSVSFKF